MRKTYIEPVVERVETILATKILIGSRPNALIDNDPDQAIDPDEVEVRHFSVWDSDEEEDETTM